eukprot:COSAG02_NODE_8235_length_2647_cov_1.845369_3_plen_223_part_00
MGRLAAAQASRRGTMAGYQLRRTVLCELLRPLRLAAPAHSRAIQREWATGSPGAASARAAQSRIARWHPPSCAPSLPAAPVPQALQRAVSASTSCGHTAPVRQQQLSSSSQGSCEPRVCSDGTDAHVGGALSKHRSSSLRSADACRLAARSFFSIRTPQPVRHTHPPQSQQPPKHAPSTKAPPRCRRRLSQCCRKSSQSCAATPRETVPSQSPPNSRNDHSV